MESVTTVARDYYKLVQRFPLLRIRGDEQLNKAQVIVDVLVDKLADRTITTGREGISGCAGRPGGIV